MQTGSMLFKLFIVMSILSQSIDWRIASERTMISPPLVPFFCSMPFHVSEPAPRSYPREMTASPSSSYSPPSSPSMITNRICCSSSKRNETVKEVLKSGFKLSFTFSVLPSSYQSLSIVFSKRRHYGSDFPIRSLSFKLRADTNSLTCIELSFA